MANFTPFLLRLILVNCLLSSLPLYADTQGSSEALIPLTVQLKWKHQFQFAGYYAALKQGFYKDAGYDVTLKEAGQGISPVEEVLSGRADYGVANSELMLFRLLGEPVTALAAIIQHSPIVLMSLKSSNIYSPQDLIGKKIMFPDGHYGANTLGILIKEGIKPSQITQIPLTFNLDDLIEKRVDAMVGYVTDQPHLLQTKGVAYNLIDPRNYGIDFYGDTLFTTERRVDDKSAEVANFRSATIDGWRYAIEHPEELIDVIIEQYNSKKSREELQYEAKETIKLIVPKLVDLGHMNPGRWNHIAETFVSLNMADENRQDDGFIYIPEKEKANESLRFFYKIAGTVFAVGLFFIILLFYFNKKLKEAVAEKTRYLTRTNKQLLRANEAKREFLSVMHHEITSPLNTIVGYTSRLLNKRDNLDNRQVEAISTVARESNELLNVMKDILDYSKIEMGEVSISNFPFTLSNLLGERIDAFSEKAMKKNLELILDVGRVNTNSVYGDCEKITQILNNYLSNAIKYTRSGSITLFATSSELIDDPYVPTQVVFGVKDTGVGISDEKIKGIFKPFVQVESFSTRKYGGTGLGLALCQRLADMQHGKVWVESEEGNGSTFYFSVDLAKEE